MNRENARRGLIEMVAAQLIFGTAGWMVVASGVPVIDMIFWRCVLGAITLTLVCSAKGLFKKSSITWPQLRLAAAGGVALITAWLLLFGSLAYASISISTAVYHTQPFMLVGLGVLLFNERFTRSRMAWLVAAFVGMLLIVQGKSDNGLYATNYLLGISMALGAALCYAIVTVLTVRLKGVKPHLIALIQMVVGAALLAPVTNWVAIPTGLRAWTFIAIFGVVGTGYVYVLLYSAYQKLPTHVIGALAFIYPVAAVIMDFFALGHRLQLLQLFGIGIVLIAAAGMTLEKRFLKPVEASSVS